VESTTRNPLIAVLYNRTPLNSQPLGCLLLFLFATQPTASYWCLPGMTL